MPLSTNHPPALDAELAAQYQVNRFGVDTVLFGENARRQGVFRVFVENRYGSLDQNRSRVEMLIDEMHRTAGKLDTVLERLMLRFEARE